MSKLTKHIVLLSVLIVFAACKNNEKKTNLAENDKQIPKTPDIPKDTLINIIKSLTDYVASPNPNDAGIAKIVNNYQKQYIIGLNTTIMNDTISDIRISSSFDVKDPDYRGMLSIVSYKEDTTRWVTFTDLTKAFGTYEDGVFDKKIPLPKEPGIYRIYTIRTSNKNPVYLCVHAYYNDESFDIRTLTLKRDKFYIL